MSGTALSSGSTDTAAATATASSAAATTTGGAISPGGFSSVGSGAVATESVESGSASGTATATSAGASGSALGDASGTATSQADSASSSAATFQLPGTKLSVLPIGLGVFAGISVIALIVVGLVTYERTKYRRVSVARHTCSRSLSDLFAGVQAAQARRIRGGYGVWWNGVSRVLVSSL